LRDLLPTAESSHGNLLMMSAIEFWKIWFKTLWCLRRNK